MRAGIRHLLLEWNPIDADGLPEDEYDCLISPLHHRLHSGATAEQLADYLTQEIREHFGFQPEPEGMTLFAAKLRQWWTDETSQATE